MLQLFKFLGLLFVFLSCASVGFLKSYLLRKRKDKLTALSRSIAQLAEYIKADGGEINQLAKICFEEEDIEIQNGIPTLNKSFLEKEDISVIEEFLSEFGLRDTLGEYRRTKLYASLTDKQREASAKKCAELCRLYNTLGVLSGVILCIFFI